MRKLSFISTITMAAALTACGHRASSATTDADTTAVDSAVVAAAPALLTDSVRTERSDSMASVDVSADWPTQGSEALVAAIRLHIAKELDTKPATDGKTVVASAAQQQHDELAGMWLETASEGMMSGMSYSYFAQVNKACESDSYVTYTTYTEGYTGGAHGYATLTGTTFAKPDGRTVGYTSVYDDSRQRYVVRDQRLFKDATSPRIFQLIKEHLRKHEFLVEEDGVLPSDEQLAEKLMVDDIDHIPLPQYAPYFTPKGLCFVYQQYEIACYAVGILSIIIPYDEIAPLLTPEAAALIGR